MGTRGLYGFRKNGVDKTTYNHFDSYPDGLGADVIESLKKDWEKEIEKYGDKELYPEGDGAALYIEDDEIYFEMSYGNDENQAVHQVWIDELEVQ